MAFPGSSPVVFVDCPACHWTKAVLAYENSRKRVFLCPHCQFLWDTTETTHKERASLAGRTTELRDEHEVLKKNPFAPAKHEHLVRLRKR
jgi:hypothetical protein